MNSPEGPHGLIDFHSHLFQYPSISDVLDGACGIVVATSRASEFRAAHAVVPSDPGIAVGIGFHPQIAGSVYEAFEREIFDGLVTGTPWVSEIGLDAVLAERQGPEFGTVASSEAQLSLFEWVTDRVAEDQMVSVHSRGAEREVVSRLRERGLTRVVFHNFAGAKDDLDAAIALGGHFSVNPWMLETSAGLDVVRAIPLGRLLLETDGPFLMHPEGRSAVPRDLSLYVRAIAQHRGMNVAELESAIRVNQVAFFREQ